MIDWKAFKTWKEQNRYDTQEYGNLVLLIHFIKQTKNMEFDTDIYDLISADSLGAQMLEKAGISNADGLWDALRIKLTPSI